jgi:hypothetical protein
MDKEKVLIVSDAGNQNYWRELSTVIEGKIGPLRIISDKDLSSDKIDIPYDLIVVDVSNIESNP